MQNRDMYDIFHSFPVTASADKVYKGVSTPEGLDKWWTKNSEGQPVPGSVYVFYFSDEYQWEAIVTKAEKDKAFEWLMTKADTDWTNSTIGFEFTGKDWNLTEVQFYHTGWPENNQHYRISSFCWAMYLRLLKRYLELGEEVPYEKRLSV